MKKIPENFTPIAIVGIRTPSGDYLALPIAIAFTKNSKINVKFAIFESESLCFGNADRKNSANNILIAIITALNIVSCSFLRVFFTAMIVFYEICYVFTAIIHAYIAIHEII